MLSFVSSVVHGMPRLPLLALTLLIASSSARAQHAPAADTLSDRQLFVAACATCHGGDGRGTPVSQLGFADPPMPDFTDCSATSREARRDWSAIVHEGGRARAFSHRMPAFGTALTDAQIARLTAYLRTFCDDRAWPRGELNLPRAISTEKAFPEDESVVTASAVTARGRRSAGGSVVYERRLGARTQWELAVPFEARERDAAEGGRWTGGRLGDIAVALKRVLFHDSARGSIVSFNGEVALPTGDARTGIGAGTTVLEPGLLAGQILPANFYLQLQTGVGFSMDRSKADHEAIWRAALGTTLTQGFGRAWSPIVELLGARALGAGNAAEWDVLPQMQVTLSRRQHVRGSVGVRLPVNARAERPRELVAYLLWDWFDGGLFEGWR
jgi:mono/diheme cytochrome c family protein